MDRWAQVATPPGRDPTTAELYATRVAMLRTAWGDRVVGTITTFDILHGFRQLLANGTPQSTVYLLHQMARQIFQAAIAWEWVAENPLDAPELARFWAQRDREVRADVECSLDGP